jgi:hypothetical protein
VEHRVVVVVAVLAYTRPAITNCLPGKSEPAVSGALSLAAVEM